MLTRSRKRKETLKEENGVQVLDDDEYLSKRQNKEDRLRNLLGPFDKYISSLECILVWDYPIVFILILVFINLLFWLYTITPFYYLLSFCLFCCLCVQFISNHLWPLINDSEDSLNGWVKLQAPNKEQFDLVRSTAHFLITFDSVYSACELLKKNNPQKFNVIGFIIFLSILIISFFVNDFYLVYISVMLLVCWPGVKHNHLPERIFTALRPHLASLERALHIRKTVNRKKLRQKLSKKVPKRMLLQVKKKKKKDKKTDKQKDTTGDVLQFSDNDSDADLEQFLPTKYDEEKAGGYDNDYDDDDDDDDSAREYLPHENITLDSRENTDDEDFIPDASQDGQWSVVDGGDKEAVKRNRKQSPRRIKSKLEKKKDTEKMVDAKRGLAGENKNLVAVVESEEIFSEGLSFDDNDDETEAVTPPTTTDAASLIGSLLGQGQTGSSVADLSGRAGGLFGRAMSGLSYLKRAITSVGGSGGGEEEALLEFEPSDLEEVEEF